MSVILCIPKDQSLCMTVKFSCLLTMCFWTCLYDDSTASFVLDDIASLIASGLHSWSWTLLCAWKLQSFWYNLMQAAYKFWQAAFVTTWDVELGSVSMWRSACQKQWDVLGENEGSSRWCQGSILVFAVASVRLIGVSIFLAVAAPRARAQGCGRAAAQLCSAVPSFVVRIWQSSKNRFLLDLKIEFTFLVLLGRCVLTLWLHVLDLPSNSVFLVRVFFLFLIFAPYMFKFSSLLPVSCFMG